MAEEIVNRVANSGLININMDDLLPSGERVVLDLAPVLFQGMMLREKDLREFVAGHDWSQYQNKHVAVTCSEDAIIPAWAFMLVAVSLTPFARTIVFGNEKNLISELFDQAIRQLDVTEYADKRILVHGCGKVEVPASAFVALSVKLQPLVKALMFGEACSTVPLYKKMS
ncbi:MAG: DUF2480 family protein [Flavobacteriales bacterium]|nr:DUF2480 family protein [Flavobacteriales bacterium]